MLIKYARNNSTDITGCLDIQGVMLDVLRKNEKSTKKVNVI